LQAVGIALLPTFIEGSLVDLQALTAPIAALARMRG